MKDKLLERVLVEMLFNKKDSPPPTLPKPRKPGKDMTVKQLMKVLKTAPELKRELEEALKRMEPEKKEEKKKDKLSLPQKFLLTVVGTMVGVPVYILLVYALFHAVTG
jgi:hypothetical protein